MASCWVFSVSLKRCQRLVEFFPRAIRHLFFALGSQLRDTVGQARFQLGRSVSSSCSL